MLETRIIEIYSQVNPTLKTHIIIKKYRNSDSANIHSENVINRNDLIEPNNALQFSVIKMHRDKTFLPHVHESHLLQSTESNTQECWVIISGKVLAEIFDTDTKLLQSIELEPGDAIITLHGGHNYRSLTDDTLAYEIKSGPYDPIKDKRRF